MASIPTRTIFDEIVDFLASGPSVAQIATFEPSEKLQLRLRDLLDKNRAGTLSAEENAELDDFVSINHFVSMVKIRARQHLKGA